MGFDPDKYLSGNGSVGGFNPDAYLQTNAPSTLEQEMPDWLSAKDRAIAKNFAQSPQKQVEYLKLKYPDAQVELQNDQVTMYKPGDKTKRVLDPDTGMFSKDFLSDLGDIAYDIPSGIAQGAATTAGTAAGFLSTLPTGGWGALPGAMASSAAASAGSEALRQKIGGWAGIPQEVSGKDVAMAGAIGAVAPAVFGANKIAAPTILQAMNTTGLAKEAVEEMANEQTKGLLRRGGAKALSGASGIKKDLMDAYRRNMGKVDDLEVGKDGGILQYTKALTDKVQDTLGGEQTRLGKNVASAIDEAKMPVDIASAKAQFQSQIDELLAKTDLTKSEAKRLNALQSTFDEYFGKQSGGELENQLTAKRAFEIQQSLKEAAKFGTEVTPENRLALSTARGASAEINKGLDSATEGLSQEAKDQYSNWKVIQDEIGKSFDDPQKTYNTISRLDSKGKKMLSERLGRLAGEGKLDIQDESDVIRAFQMFADPASNPLSMAGTTSTSRTIPLALSAGGAGTYIGHKLGGIPGAMIGGGAGTLLGNYAGSPAFVKKMIKAGVKFDQFGNVVDVPKYLNPALTQGLLNMRRGSNE